MTALEKSEAARLCELEQTIDRGIRSFVEVGQALAEIRDSRLYRETHGTFDDYCRDRWEFSKVRATQFITAASVVAEVTTVTTEVPATESVARELAPLRESPEALREAWAEAVEVADGKPTAKDVKAVVEQYRSDPPEPKPEPQYTCCPTCGQRVRADRPLKRR